MPHSLFPSEPSLPWTHPWVRDLAWVLGAPSVLNLLPEDCPADVGQPVWWTMLLEDMTPVLDQLDRDPQPLMAFMTAEPDRRLGAYFERLLHFALEQSPRFEVLRVNWPVRDEQRNTLGAFDFILWDEVLEKTLHWEVAVKFYLGTGDLTAMSSWWGPMKNDRLDRKYLKMRDQQLRLAYAPEAQQTLQEAEIQIDESWGFIKGRAFYPLGREPRIYPEAEPGHLRAWWGDEHAVTGLNWPEGHQWLHLPKSLWCAPLQQQPTQRPLAFDGLMQLIRRRDFNYPECVAVMADGQEVSRGFITPPGWERW